MGRLNPQCMKMKVNTKSRNTSGAYQSSSESRAYNRLLPVSSLHVGIHQYLVAPEARREKVKEQINRPTLAKLGKPLVKICRWMAFERLITELAEHERVIRHMKIDWYEDDISESCVKRDH